MSYWSDCGNELYIKFLVTGYVYIIITAYAIISPAPAMGALKTGWSRVSG